MTTERKNDRSIESEGSPQAYMVAIVINDSSEIIPVTVSPEFDDRFSKAITSEANLLREQNNEHQLSAEDQEKLEVLSGNVVAPIHLTIKDEEVVSYEVHPFTEFSRLELEWFELLDSEPELCAMCETDKKHYDIVFQYFKLRHNNINTDPALVSKLASEFSDSLDEDTDFAKLKPYFETVTLRFF